MPREAEPYAEQPLLLPRQPRGEKLFTRPSDEVNDHFESAGKRDRACNRRWRSLYEGLMGISMNTTLSGSGRVDDIQSHAQGEIRGRTELIKITEDVRKYAAGQKISEEQALKVGFGPKSQEVQRIRR
jgi:hypothetical protein